MKDKCERVNDFMVIFSAVTGITAGGGSLFIGFIKANFIVIILSFIAILVGALAGVTIVKEEDEYEKLASSIA